MNKKLYRSTESKLIAGVLGGLAEYYESDVVFWRLGAVVAIILAGFMPGVLIYIVAWVMIPERPTVEPLNKADYKVYE